MTDDNELKLCPFCGGEAEEYINAQEICGIACTECGACVEDSEAWLVANKWNARVEDSPK